MQNYSSEKRFLNEDFAVPFNVCVKIPVREVPECLHLEIREDGRTLHAIDFSVPNSKASFERSVPETLEFASTDEIVKTGHAGVGSGIKFKILSEVSD